MRSWLRALVQPAHLGLTVAVGLTACGGEALTRLDLRGVQRDNLAVILFDASDRVLTVSGTLRPRESQSNQGLSVPDDAESLKLLAWDDEQLAEAYPCYRALESAELELRPDDQTAVAGGSDRLQRLRVDIPASFETRAGVLDDGITLFSEVPEADNSALRGQLEFRVQADTEALALPFGDLVPVELQEQPPSVRALAWVDDRRALILSQRRLSLIEPATQQLLHSVDLPGPANTVYDAFDVYEMDGERRIVVVGSGQLGVGAPRPDSFTASCTLIGDTLTLVGSGGANFGGLTAVTFTSSTTFIAGGFTPTLTESLNLQEGIWGGPTLVKKVDLQSISRGDRMERIITTPDGLLVSARQRLHYGPLLSIQSQVMNEGVFPERMRIYAVAAHEGVSWAAGEFGSLWRRGLERFSPFTEALQLPPRFTSCGLTIEGRLSIGRENTRDMYVDDTSLWLQLERCAAPLVIDKATGCGSLVLGDAQLPQMLVDENVLDLDVGAGGALVGTDFGRLWFAPRL